MAEKGTSCYAVVAEIFLAGFERQARWGRTTLDEIKADVAKEVSASTTLSLLLGGESSFDFFTIDGGEIVYEASLLPHLTVAIEGYPTLTFDSKGQLVGYPGDYHEDEMNDEGLASALFDGEVDDVINATINWDALDIPVLTGPLLSEGGSINIKDRWAVYPGLRE